MSSVALTPASSPDSSISAGLLRPPPSMEHHIQRPPTDVFDMVPFSSGSPMARKPAINGSSPPPPSFSPPPPPPHVFLRERGTDVLGAEPFDPFLCNTSFPPDVQSKLDEMQEGFNMGLTLEGTIFSLDPVDSRC
nr:PTB domain-containing engulfment adapter protein 1-like [Oncorhynchus nerka]